jgi:hypothetical protein
MKYMLLIYGEENAWSASERQECFLESARLTHDLAAKGQFLGASPLQAAATASCVRVRNHQPLITDGPFTEAREQLGGYFLIEAANREEALAIAARLPSALKGTVEVRPMVDLENLVAAPSKSVDSADSRSIHSQEKAEHAVQTVS